MIMVPPFAEPAPMRQSLTAQSAALDDPSALDPTQPAPRVTRLLGERLELVEDLWKTVLRSECPPSRPSGCCG